MTPAQPADRVLIAGAGPVAMTTALLLARWRVPSLLLEAKPRPDAQGSKAICFQRDVLDVLDRVGVAEQAVAEGVTWRVGRTYYRHHELFSVTLPDSGSDALPPFINLSQSALEGYLRDRVAASPLIEIAWGHRVSDVTTSGDGVVVTVTTGDGLATLEGPYLVGADGSRSTVRQAIGATFEGESFEEQFLIADIEARLPFPAERRFHFDPEWNPGRQVLVHPQPHSIWRIDWQVPADFDLEAERASGALDARIRRITGDAPYRIDWMSVYRFHQRLADPWRAGDVFLAGDAAHLMSPFGARGLNSGAQDAENLAWKLAWTLHGWAGPGLLDSYAAERVPAAEENLAVTAETMRFLVPRTTADARTREEVLESAVTDPSARERVNSGSLATPFVYADSPLTTPGEGSPVPGTLCPDVPEAIEVEGVRHRFRRALGGGLVVVACGPEVPVVTWPGPTSVQQCDPGSPLSTALGLSLGEAAVIRPDGHLAARVPLTHVTPAATRALALT